MKACAPVFFIAVGNICIASCLNAKKTLILSSTRWISLRKLREVDEVAALTPRRMAHATTVTSIPPQPAQIVQLINDLNSIADFR